MKLKHIINQEKDFVSASLMKDLVPMADKDVEVPV